MSASTVVLITGASAGIGAYVAKEYATRGAKLILTARRKKRLEELAAECERLSPKCEAIAVPVDVTKEDDLTEAVAAGVEKFGKVDCVIANAGFSVLGEVENLTIADYERQFDTNIYGVLRTFYAAIKQLKKYKGRFVIVGSVNSYITLPTASPYCMSKFAVRALAEALYSELKSHGVSTTLVCPGFVDSEIRQVDNSGTHHPEAKDLVPAWICMPTDVAARKIVRAVEARKREYVFTGHGKFFVALRQQANWIFQLLIALFASRLIKRREIDKSLPHMERG